MYTRNYFPDEQATPSVPDNYDGTAFSEAVAQEPTAEEKSEQASASVPLLGGLFGKGSLPFLDGIKMPKIGTEELLILAVAAFLFFSKNGDRECALILLFLIFVN